MALCGLGCGQCRLSGLEHRADDARRRLRRTRRVGEAVRPAGILCSAVGQRAAAQNLAAAGRASLNESAAATARIGLRKIVAQGRPRVELGYLAVPRGLAPGQRCTPASLRHPILLIPASRLAGAPRSTWGSPLVRTKVRATHQMMWALNYTSSSP